jgi:hypothetical protein
MNRLPMCFAAGLCAALTTTAAFSAQQGTTTEAYVSSSMINPGAAVTMSAVVRGNTPTGVVRFYDNTVTLGNVTLTNGTAVLTTTALTAPGSHPILAAYQGDVANYPSSGAASITVTSPAATISSTRPSRLTAGSLDTMIWIRGTGFVSAPLAVLVNGTLVPSQYDSPAQLRAILPPGLLAGAGSLSLVIRTGDSSRIAPDSAPFTLPVDAPGPPPLTVAINGSVATASHVTPGGNTAWLVNATFPNGGASLTSTWVQLLRDADSDGAVTFDGLQQTAPIYTIPPKSVVAVADITSGAVRIEVPSSGTRKENFFPLDVVQGLRDGGKPGRLKLGYYRLTLLVRPGVGAWYSTSAYGQSFVASDLAPLPGSPPSALSFNAGDVLVGLNDDSFTTGNLSDYYAPFRDDFDHTQNVLTIDEAEALEGNGEPRSLVFSVRLARAAGNSDTVTVQYAALDGTAAAGSDFTSVNGTLTFSPGESSREIVVPIAGDTVPEFDETLTMLLSSATQAIVSVPTARGTIVNDDPLPQLSIADASSDEGSLFSSRSMPFAVSLSQPTSTPVNVTLRFVPLTADYDDVLSTFVQAVLPAGRTLMTVSLPLAADPYDEEDERFAVEVDYISGATVARGRATATIVDDDAPPLLTAIASDVLEPTGGDLIAQIPVKLSELSGKPLSVDYEVVANGTASAADLVLTRGTLNLSAFPPSALPNTIPVTIKPDTLRERPETFSIVFSNPVNLDVQPSPAAATIVDDDGPRGPYAAAVAADQAVAYYRLDEPGGTVAHDSSANRLDATCTPTVLWNAQGALGSRDPAASFANAAIQQISLPGTWGGPSWTEATLEAWVRLAQGPFTNAGSADSAIINVEPPSNSAIYLPVPAIPPGWHYLVVVAQSGASRLYLDGVVVAEDSLPFSNLRVTTEALVIAGQDAQVDEVAIYRRALTAADVARHYALRSDRLTADLDGNGSNDLVLRNASTGANALWLLNRTSYVSTENLPFLPSDFRIEGAADFDRDGQTDLLLRNYANGNNAIWLMNGTSIKGIVNLPWLPTTSGFRFEGTADVNADGSPDILIRNYGNGNNAVWEMNDAAFAAVENLPALPDPNYRMVGGGDFNGDGKADIVWRNQVTGNNAVWLMNGTSLLSVANLPALPNTAYHFSGIADYDVDGKPDIVLRNYTTGANAIWLLNGTALKSIADLPTLPNPAYEIVGPR